MNEALLKRLEAATDKLEKLANAGGISQPAATQQAGSSTASIAEFDNLIGSSLQAYLTASSNIDAAVKKQAELVSSCFTAQKQIIIQASNSKKPANQQDLQNFIKPLQQLIGHIQELKEKNRTSPFFNHLSVVSEGIACMGWIVVDKTPVPYINEMKEAAQFYANRIIKDHKEKNPSYVEWASSFTALIVDLSVYVKKWHTTGLTWNPKGGDVCSAPTPSTTSNSSSSAPAKPALPAVDSNTLKDALNSSNLTSKLKKVDKSEMTHKNPALRASSVVPATAAPIGSIKSFAAPLAKPTQPPKLALEGSKWVVENYVGNPSVVIEKTELRHVVYIYNCTNSTISINGKVNAVTLDNCKKVGLLVENAVSSIDIINCKSSQVQITGKVPTVKIDKTDGLQLYLSKDCADIDIMTAKSSEMNVHFPDAKAGGDFVEKPIHEQFITKLVAGNLVTRCVEHQG
jgi:adenylyl cyclase-associated protein